MCLFRPCADPTTLGVWWREDAEWRPYDSLNQQQIRLGLSQGLNSIDLGIIRSDVHPAGARYTADLTTMQQINVSSGQRRDIKVVDRVSSGGSQAILPNIPIPVEGAPRRLITVHSRDSSGQLRQYEPQLGDGLLRALIGNQATFEYNTTEWVSRKLLFDLTRMKQTGTNNGEELDVIIEVVWNPVTLSIVASSRMFRRKVVCDLIERNVRSDRLLNFLKPKLFPRKLNATLYNPYLSAGNHVYDSFVDFVESSIFGKESGADRLLQIANAPYPSDNLDGFLKIAFSSKAPEKDGHCIFKRGFYDQSCSFNVFALETMASTIKNMQKLLVLIVILDAAAPRSVQQIFPSKRGQHLPVAEIHVRSEMN
ncbi:hypothetical protein O6H91_19G084700 [Diphasiastrum complanatum]|uniref:Uncharacterized protein n=1 Tax=Diphasiastrum complanatum TaxID=34168 RepID=A0ACC2AX41_DIPCM|nr:hypothetical protein O6H91_19G084700 [Diphasiastrum complanatum]